MASHLRNEGKSLSLLRRTRKDQNTSHPLSSSLWLNGTDYYTTSWKEWNQANSLGKTLTRIAWAKNQFLILAKPNWKFQWNSARGLRRRRDLQGHLANLAQIQLAGPQIGKRSNVEKLVRPRTPKIGKIERG